MFLRILRTMLEDACISFFIVALLIVAKAEIIQVHMYKMLD
jgi:hypothetical protein